MNLRQIEIFCAVMRSRTTVAAGFDLGISQPAVSTALKHMEAQTGLKLFERLGNRLVPTHEAHELYRDTGPLKAMSEALTVKVRDLRQSRRGHLRVLSTQAMANAVTSRAFAAFLARRPHVQAYFEVERTEGIVELIESGFADLGLSISPQPRPGIEVERVTVGAMVVALPQGHVLSRQPAIEPRDLRGDRLIGIESGARLGAIVRQAFESVGVEYRPAIEVRHGATARLLVEQGVGVAIIDPFSALAGSCGVETRAFVPRLDVEGCVMRLQGRPPSRLAARFLVELREMFGGDEAGPIQGGAPEHGQRPRQPSAPPARRR